MSQKNLNETFLYHLYHKKIHYVASAVRPVTGKKDDTIYAGKLAQLAKGKYIKEIYHFINNRRRFKKQVFAYHDRVKSQKRIKNKIKATFKRKGILCGGALYNSEKYRKEWRKKLRRNKVVHLIVYELWAQLDQIQNDRKKLKRNIRIHGKQYPEIKWFIENDSYFISLIP